MILSLIVTNGPSFYIWWNWKDIKERPGVSWFLQRAMPHAPAERLTIAVAHLEDDEGRKQGRQLLAGLEDFEGVETLNIDRMVEWPASGTEAFWDDLKQILGLLSQTRLAEITFGQEGHYVADRLAPLIRRFAAGSSLEQAYGHALENHVYRYPRLGLSVIINETWYHTIITGTAAFECNGKKAEFGPVGFNYMPARKVHEAWVAAGAVIFITLDGKALQRPPTVAHKFDPLIKKSRLRAFFTTASLTGSTRSPTRRQEINGWLRERSADLAAIMQRFDGCVAYPRAQA